MTADKEKIRQKINFIETNLVNLRELASLEESKFTGDPIKIAAAVRMLQVAIEAMIDTANHIVARERLGLPKTYAEAFSLLTKAGVIPEDILPSLRLMVKFRNRAVHMYEEISPAEIYRILQEHLGDFERFIAVIVEKVLS